MPVEYVPVEPLQVRTLQEAADLMGIGRQRAQKLEAAAMRKIRSEIERQAFVAGMTVFEWLND